MKLFFIIFTLLFTYSINTQISHTFELFEFKYSNDTEFININDNNYLQIHTLPNNHNISQISADVQLETFYICNLIYNYSYKKDTCGNITISYNIKRKPRHNKKLNVIITKNKDDNYYLINIFRRFTDFDIYFKAKKT